MIPTEGGRRISIIITTKTPCLLALTRQVAPLEEHEVLALEKEEASQAREDKKKGLRHLRASRPYIRFGAPGSAFGPLRFGGVQHMAEAPATVVFDPEALPPREVA